MPENQWGNQHLVTIKCCCNLLATIAVVLIILFYYLGTIWASASSCTLRVQSSSASPASVPQLSTAKLSLVKCNSQGVRVSIRFHHSLAFHLI